MASTQEVFAATEEQSASVEQVNIMAENLAVISDKLQQSVAQFKIISIDGKPETKIIKRTDNL